MRLVCLIDEADVLDAQPVDALQDAGHLASGPARAYDDREGLVVTAAAQGADDGPSDAPADQHQGHAQIQKIRMRGPRFVGIVQEENASP